MVAGTWFKRHVWFVLTIALPGIILTCRIDCIGTRFVIVFTVV